MGWQIFLLLLGFGALVLGAESLVHGAKQIAKAFGVSTLIIGLTVVAFGTSAPELFVSTAAAFKGTADVAVGNIIGSNLFNVLVIIGLSAIISPLNVSSGVVKREMPIMIAALGIFWLASINGKIGRVEGSFIFAGILAYLALNYYLVLRDSAAAKAYLEGQEDVVDIEKTPPQKYAKSLGFILLGLAGLVGGSELIVDSATTIAKTFGISDLVIGVTLVAVGTSLPEVATTAVAAFQGESDLSVGNAVGSNIFNVLCVIGLTAIITPLVVSDSALNFDMAFMFFACAAVWPLMFFRRRLARVEGVLLILVYVAYIFFVFKDGVAL